MSNVKRKHSDVVHQDEITDKKQTVDDTIHIFRKAELGIHGSTTSVDIDKEYEEFQKIIQLETETAQKTAEDSELQALLDMAKAEERVTLEWQKRVQDLKSLASETIHAKRETEQKDVLEQDKESSSDEEADVDEEKKSDSESEEDMETIESFFQTSHSLSKK